MRLLISFVLAGLAAFALIACKSADSTNRVASSSTPATPAKPKATPAAAAPADGVRRITTVELQDLISKGQAYVVDVRNEAVIQPGSCSRREAYSQHRNSAALKGITP